MGALVLKQWSVKNEVDQAGNYVFITGREGGFIAWILALLGVDPTTSIKVSMKRVEFQQSSLAGTSNRMIPLQGVCSTYYGYHKPWKESLGLFVVLTLLFGYFGMTTNSGGITVFGMLISIVLAIVYYFLNRTLTLGFVENSGVISGIHFKRSVIENVDVNEKQARLVCELTQTLIEKVLNEE
jgi:hypothetical protein